MPSSNEVNHRSEAYSAVDIFSGPGGLSSGFENAGFKIVLAIDKNPDACLTYKLNHPEVECWQRSISAVKGKEILNTVMQKGERKIDVVFGGPPCRGLSSANRRTGGSKNPQNKLLLQFVRVVREIQPRAFVLENVRSLSTFKGGTFKRRIVRRLEIDGYNISSAVLNAAGYGIPQLRNRTFIVGIKNAKFEFPPCSHGPGLRKYVTVREALSDLPRIIRGSGGLDIQRFNSVRNNYQRLLRKGSNVVRNHRATISHKEVIQLIRKVPPGGNWEDIARSLHETGKYRNISKTHSSLYRRMNPKLPAFTILNLRKNMYIHHCQDRLLSVREAARIQSFPDSYVFTGSLGSMQQQVADAVPPLLAKAVAHKLRRTLSNSDVDYPTKLEELSSSVLERSSPLVLSK